MNIPVKSRALGLGVLYVLAFVLSLVLWFSRDTALEGVTLFFPDQRDQRVFPETRGIPRGISEEQRQTFIVQAVLAGPEDMNLGRIAPEGTKLKQVFRVGSRLFVSLGASFQAPDPRVGLPPLDRLLWLKKSILFNSFETREVTFLINNLEVPEN